MIGTEKVAEIRRLLAEGRYSQRRIAAMVGVSRGTVNAIAHGRRKERSRSPNGENALFAGPFVRCPGCGGRVRMPCLLCGVRGLVARAKYHVPQQACKSPPRS
jgi:hypothetical protein